MSEPEDIEDIEDGDEDDLDLEDMDDADRDEMVEECQRLIAAIPKLIPGAKIEVNGQILTAEEIVAQLQGYLGAVAATDAARAKYEAAMQAAEESSERLESALRKHHASSKPEDRNN